jgi:hypothetical protein
LVEVQTLVTTSINVSWDVTLCGLVELNRRFGGKCCLCLQCKRSYTVNIVNFYQTTRRHIKEDSNIYAD